MIAEAKVLDGVGRGGLYNEPWAAADAYDDADEEYRIVHEKLDALGDEHPLAVKSWEDFYNKLAEGEADIAAGRVYTTEEVSRSLERGILTGVWDDD